MLPIPQPLHRRPAYEQVADQLLELILNGDLPLGAPLPPERELCDQFDVGRTTVREALRSLQTKGLVVATGPTSPLRVVASENLTVGPLRDALVYLLRLRGVPLESLIGLRGALEGAGAEGAATRKPAPDLTAARDQIAFMRAAATDVDAFDAADVRFHLEIVRASGNEALTLIMLAVRDAVSEALLTRLKALDDPQSMLKRLIGEHEAILNAVTEGDGETARRLSIEHLRRYSLSIEELQRYDESSQ